MQFQHQDNGQNGEFFSLNESGERIAEISYVWSNDQQIIANHTWVDHSLRGQGVARQLLDALVAFAREKHLKIIGTCSYVELMFKRDKSLADVVG
ncbi:N-acetyltransferase [Acinetobacter sp. 194]|uniref:GNAT family N-acetyltransferase n=1 Tax=Acinetobacter shaoyimingii TaxID=2715164 RepID=UPI001407DA43|nr:GNAT family N-acetyltransferase [Acinetobacter shaoyimingii]NHB59463.1 N-acetyltransferase [Acinetobacter shaoyimingii]